MQKMYFHGNMYREATLFQKFHLILLSKWFDERHGHFYSVDVSAALKFGKLAHEIAVKNSRVPLPDT